MGEVLEGRPYLFVEWIFIGGAGVALAINGLFRKVRGKRVWIATVVLGLGLAMGDHAHLIELWWKVLPFFARFRYPEKYIGIVTVALGLLVAWGVDEAAANPRRSSRVILVAGLPLYFGGFLFMSQPVAHLLLRVAHVELTGDLFNLLQLPWYEGMQKTSALVILLTFIVFLKPFARTAIPAIPVLIFFELTLWNGGRLPLVDRALVKDAGPIASALMAQHRAGEPPPRVRPAESMAFMEDLSNEAKVRLKHLSLDPDNSARSGIDTFAINEPGEQWRVMRTFFGRKGVPSDVWEARFNVCHRVSSGTPLPLPFEQPMSHVFEGQMASSAGCVSRAPISPAPNRSRTRRPRRIGCGPGSRMISSSGRVGRRWPKRGDSVQWTKYEPGAPDAPGRRFRSIRAGGDRCLWSRMDRHHRRPAGHNSCDERRGPGAARAHRHAYGGDDLSHAVVRGWSPALDPGTPGVRRTAVRPGARNRLRRADMSAVGVPALLSLRTAVVLRAALPATGRVGDPHAEDAHRAVVVRSALFADPHVAGRASMGDPRLPGDLPSDLGVGGSSRRVSEKPDADRRDQTTAAADGRGGRDESRSIRASLR